MITSLSWGRVVWILVTLVALALSAAGVPARYEQLVKVCHNGEFCGQFGYPLSARFLPDLYAAGLTLQFYAVFTIFVETATAFVSAVLGALLVVRARSGLVLFTAAVLVASAEVSTNLPEALAAAHPVWSEPVSALAGLALASLTIFLFVFPDGRFVPGWTRWAAVLTAVGYSIAFLFPHGALQPINNEVSLAGEISLFMLGVAAQIYRYRHVSGQVARQQTKWVVFGLAVALIISALLIVSPLIVPARNPFVAMAEDAIFSLCSLLIPITIVVAVLHHRLYDIDTLVNRALVYGLLTFALAGFYFGSVIVLQSGFRAVTGQKTDLAIAISTLALAALFNPLRVRIQAFIDRRFYRRRYDAAQALSAFGARLRDEVDLDHLAADLVDLLEDTVEPASVALWLQESERGTA